jgi:hypothetical protein
MPMRRVAAREIREASSVGMVRVKARLWALQAVTAAQKAAGESWLRSPASLLMASSLMAWPRLQTARPRPRIARLRPLRCRTPGGLGTPQPQFQANFRPPQDPSQPNHRLRTPFPRR